ncbi:helix-turn-helix transcriptional regulator [Brevibacillus centrosporus]|uniref:helix-turn-helix domain-containing protein n=1 Tax=Brevibacillus centrosporus TaxID=54910 RepID=UPI003D20F462
MEHGDRERLLELAHFLKTRRARISPELAGLPQAGRRRTPGLRRGEVAQLAGVSVDWYTWLEQGRDIQVSTQVIESIARALQLDATERRHFFCWPCNSCRLIRYRQLARLAVRCSNSWIFRGYVLPM